MTEGIMESLGGQLFELVVRDLDWGEQGLLADEIGMKRQTFSAILRKRRLAGRDSSVLLELRLGVPADSWGKPPVASVSTTLLRKVKALPEILKAHRQKQTRKAS